MCHLLLAAPDEPEAWDVSDEFLFGPDVLMASVLEECASPCEVLLPPGHAHDVDRATRVTVDAPLGSPAVFYRRGSMVAEAFAVAR